MQNKFDSLADIIKDNIETLMISETKVKDSFPDGQFSLDGFGTPFRLNRNRNGGGVTCFPLEMIFLQKLVLQMTGLFKVFK